jgi:hypothetical protein
MTACVAIASGSFVGSTNDSPFDGFFGDGILVADNSDDSDSSGGKILIGGRGSFFFGGAGGTLGGSIGVDSNFKFCGQVTTCARLGVGAAVGGTGTLTVGKGTFIEGTDLSVGVFGNVGLGPFGSINTQTSVTTGNTSVTGAYGGGAGASGGAQMCVTETICPFD